MLKPELRFVFYFMWARHQHNSLILVAVELLFKHKELPGY